MSADRMDGMLIADTSETGEVAWVGVLETGDGFLRPVRRRDVGLTLERFTLTGAPRDQIASWIGATATV